MVTIAQADALGVDCVNRTVGTGEAALVAARERAAILDAITHPGVLKPLEVCQEADGTVVAVMPRLDGNDLAHVLHIRGSLRAGECVTVGMGVAIALDAMHRAGIAHGDISPANIMVSATTVTVVDTMAGASTHEAGTDGFAAPERTTGASAPSDVYSLGRVLASAVREADRDVIEAWVAPMLAADPAVRPSAAMVARALEACAPAETVHVPALGVAEAMRTRALTEAPPTTRKPEARWWRVRRALVRWAVAVSASALCLTLAFGVGPAAWRSLNPPAPPGFDPPMPIPASAAIAAHQAAAAVTEARFRALAAGDADALLATTVEGSPARATLEPLAQSLADGSVQIRGVAVTVDAVDVVSNQGRRASAVVAYTVAAHTVISAGIATDYPAYSQTVELDLLWSSAGWQVERARVSET